MAAFKCIAFLSFSLLFVFGVHAQLQTLPTNISTGFVRFNNVTDQVTYFYTQGGLVAYDGDIIFGTVAEFNQALINITYTSDPNRPPSKRSSDPPPPDSIVKRANSIFPGTTGIWPGGIVYYRYFDSAAESALSAYVDGGIKAWTDGVPCLKFVKLPNDNDSNGSNGIVTIKAHNPNVGYCLASSIGYKSGRSLWMELDTGGGCGIPEVTHEWGHLLGLIHEHKRPDRPYPFLCGNLDPPCCAPPPFCCGWACQFQISNTDYNVHAKTGATFDEKSIMLYTNHEFAQSGKQTLPGAPNAHAQKPSPDDILRVRELYGCLPTSPSTCSPGCNPTVGKNTCHFPTAQDCIYPSPFTSNPRAACACRAGFKATVPGVIADTDVTKQWRLPADEGNFRVWVAEGVACDTLCDGPPRADSCKEVSEQPAECLHL